MTGHSDDVTEPPRRRRRASRRAAGPPVSVSRPPVAERADDAGQVAGRAADDPTIGAEDTTMDVVPVADAGVSVGSSGTAGPAESGHPHGSPADAPEHQPGNVVHGPAGGHSP